VARDRSGGAQAGRAERPRRRAGGPVRRPQRRAWGSVVSRLGYACGAAGVAAVGTRHAGGRR
jgi:hypothetical protein